MSDGEREREELQRLNEERTDLIVSDLLPDESVLDTGLVNAKHRFVKTQSAEAADGVLFVTDANRYLYASEDGAVVDVWPFELVKSVEVEGAPRAGFSTLVVTTKQDKRYEFLGGNSFVSDARRAWKRQGN